MPEFTPEQQAAIATACDQHMRDCRVQGTDLHALIHRMADELDHYRQLLTDDRRELHPLATEARAALADGPAVPEGREPASVTAKPSDQLYVLFASLEWKFGCHMSEWKAARELASRMGKPGGTAALEHVYCDGVVRLLREHLEAYGQT